MKTSLLWIAMACLVVDSSAADDTATSPLVGRWEGIYDSSDWEWFSFIQSPPGSDAYHAVRGPFEWQYLRFGVGGKKVVQKASGTWETSGWFGAESTELTRTSANSVLAFQKLTVDAEGDELKVMDEKANKTLRVLPG